MYLYIFELVTYIVLYSEYIIKKLIKLLLNILITLLHFPITLSGRGEGLGGGPDFPAGAAGRRS